MEAISREKGVTAGQIALAWVLSHGNDIVPIPGTMSVRHLEENVAALGIHLSGDDLARIEEVFPRGAASGARYPEAAMRTLGR